MQRMFYSAEGPRSVDERDVLHVYQGGERLGLVSPSDLNLSQGKTK